MEQSKPIHRRWMTRHLDDHLYQTAKLIAFNTKMNLEQTINRALLIGLPALEAEQKALAKLEGRVWNGTGGKG